MNKILQFAAVLAFAIVASTVFAADAPTVFRPDAGTMFSHTSTTKAQGVDEVVAAVQIPSTATVPSAVTDGFNLATLQATFDVYVDISLNPSAPANDAGTYDPTGAGDANYGFASNTLPSFTVLAYQMNPVTLKWGRIPAYDIAVTGNTTSFVKAGIARPSNVGRLAYVVPTSLSCPTNIRIISKK